MREGQVPRQWLQSKLFQKKQTVLNLVLNKSHPVPIHPYLFFFSFPLPSCFWCESPNSYSLEDVSEAMLSSTCQSLFQAPGESALDHRLIFPWTPVMGSHPDQWMGWWWGMASCGQKGPTLSHSPYDLGALFALFWLWVGFPGLWTSSKWLEELNAHMESFAEAHLGFAEWGQRLGKTVGRQSPGGTCFPVE